MKERPILFSAPMVRAILAGTKTQTRRAIRIQPKVTEQRLRETGGWVDGETLSEQVNAAWQNGFIDVACPYGQPGDRLWVRETWMPDAPRDGTWADVQFYGCKGSPLSWIPKRYQTPEHCIYRSTWTGSEMVGWTPSIHMPRWASRINLEVTGVRVERLQDISEADAKAEGVTPHQVRQMWVFGASAEEHADMHRRAAVDPYRELWETINGAGSWAANPWVWVVEFRRAGADRLAA